MRVLEGCLDEVIVLAPAEHEAAEHLARGNLVEAIWEVAAADAFALALVHLGAVGRDRHHDVVGAEPEMLRDLHGGDDVADARESERVEYAEDFRRHAAPAARYARPDGSAKSSDS